MMFIGLDLYAVRCEVSNGSTSVKGMHFAASGLVTEFYRFLIIQ